MYDVFFSYNQADESAVEAIANALREHDLNIWFDKWMIRGGENFQQVLQQAIREIRVIAVFIGPNGMGNWQSSEVEASVNKMVTGEKKVIPVLLPGVNVNDDRIPFFLQTLSAVRFESMVTETKPLIDLEWSITGINPLHRNVARRAIAKPQPSEAMDNEQDALNDLWSCLSTDNITFFVGRNASECISECDITEELLSEISLIAPDDGWLLPLDVAASYYAYKKTDNILENNVRKLLEKGETIPPEYNELAELLRVLTKRPEKRGRHRQRQLLVTSCFDTALEKALMLRGIGFSRLVQYRTGNKIEVHEYPVVTKVADGSLIIQPKEGEPLQLTNQHLFGQLDNALPDPRFAVNAQPIPVENLTEPIVYKLYGSRDLPNSSVLSRDQFFDYFIKAEETKIVPEQIAQIVATTAIVYLGCRIVDPDFLWSEMLLRRPLAARSSQTTKQYMVHPKDVGDQRDCGYQIGMDAWNKLHSIALSKYLIEMIDADMESFVRRLREGLQQV